MKAIIAEINKVTKRIDDVAALILKNDSENLARLESRLKEYRRGLLKALELQGIQVSLVYGSFMITGVTPDDQD